MANINYLDDNAGDYGPYDYNTGNQSDSADWRDVAMSAGATGQSGGGRRPINNSGFSGMGTTGIGGRGTTGFEIPGLQTGGTDSGGYTFYTPPNGNTGINGTGGQSQYRPWDFNEFVARGTELGRQYSGSLDDFTNHIFPTLNSEYQGLERFGSKGDKIRLPNGQVIDAVIAAGEGGRGYNWGVESPTSGGGYSSDPLIGQYIDRMNGFIDRLSGPQQINPTLQDAIGKLQGMFDHPGYTDAQRALMRTNLQEPLESQRSSAQQRALGRASDRGLGLGSGVLEQEAQGIDQGFDRMLGEGLRQMSVNEIGMQNQQRMGSAGQLAGIGQGMQGQELQALVQAMGGAQSLGQLPMQLQMQQIAAMNALGNQQVPQQDNMNGLISLLMGLAGQGEGAYNNAMGQEGGFWQSLFGQIPALAGLFTGGGGGNTPQFTGDVVSGGYPHA